MRSGAAASAVATATPLIEVAVLAESRIAAKRLALALRADDLHVTVPPTIESFAESGAQVHVIVLSGALDDDALDRLRTLRTGHAESRLVCVLPKLDWRTARTLLRAGASGLVREDQVERTLEPAVRSAYAGQLTLPSELRGQMAEPTLSTREKQILAMVVMGFSNYEIAAKLFVAESTVKSHLSSAFAKLGVRSRNEATALILDPAHGLGTGILEISGERRPRARGSERATAGRNG
jgi:DNA-binding NarL/FixJ family response regulator